MKNHMKIQKQLEMEKPQMILEMLEINEKKAIEEGWDNLAQQEYFTNIDRYEDLSFVGHVDKEMQSEMDLQSYMHGKNFANHL